MYMYMYMYIYIYMCVCVCVCGGDEPLSDTFHTSVTKAWMYKRVHGTV